MPSPKSHDFGYAGIYHRISLSGASSSTRVPDQASRDSAPSPGRAGDPRRLFRPTRHHRAVDHPAGAQYLALRLRPRRLEDRLPRILGPGLPRYRPAAAQPPLAGGHRTPGPSRGPHAPLPRLRPNGPLALSRLGARFFNSASAPASSCVTRVAGSTVLANLRPRSRTAASRGRRVGRSTTPTRVPTDSTAPTRRSPSSRTTTA